MGGEGGGGGGGGGGGRKKFFSFARFRPLPSRARFVYFFALKNREAVDSLHFPRINGPMYRLHANMERRDFSTKFCS